MGVYSHKQSFSLRCNDLDFKDEVKPSALLAFAQEAAVSSADELGFGYEALKRDGRGFIVASTYCEIFKPIRIGDVLTVETWPLPPRHIIFERGYRVFDRNGEPAAALASRWCLVDLKSFTPLTPDKLGRVHAECPYRAEKAVEAESWRIPRLLDEGTEVLRMQVKNSHCDHYLHANNTRYMDFFCDCFTMEELSARTLRAFQISYLKQAKEGSELVLYRKDNPKDAVLEARVEGELISACRVFWTENKQ